jgi:hypothetical protein
MVEENKSVEAGKMRGVLSDEFASGGDTVVVWELVAREV